MKVSRVLLLASQLLASFALADPQEAAAPTSASAAAHLTPEVASYIFGLTLGEQLRDLGVAGGVPIEAVEHGFQEGLNGKWASKDERIQVQQYVNVTLEAQAERNQRVAQEFRVKNARRRGMQVTASGLQYRVITTGDAKAPVVQPTDEVTVNYRGHLIDGTEFDSSYLHGAPASIALDGAIKGWREGLVLMKPGAKYELFLPPELGYGSQALPGIPANSVLVFDVELLSAKRGEPPSEPLTPPSAPPRPPATMTAPGRTTTWAPTAAAGGPP